VVAHNSELVVVGNNKLAVVDNSEPLVVGNNESVPADSSPAGNHNHGGGDYGDVPRPSHVDHRHNRREIMTKIKSQQLKKLIFSLGYSFR
jgi:hypothetical protein